MVLVEGVVLRERELLGVERKLEAEPKDKELERGFGGWFGKDLRGVWDF